MVPSIEDCHALMDKYEMLDNIKAHSVMVEKVAAIIGKGLKEAGESISLDVVSAGALMHDIAKTTCLKTGEDHAAMGRGLCIENQFDEIAEIVGQHVLLKAYNPGDGISESQIVYYADKRVNHDTIVSLEERLRDLLIRYGKNKSLVRSRIRQNFRLAGEVEKQIFSHLKFRPGDVRRLVLSDEKVGKGCEKQMSEGNAAVHQSGMLISGWAQER